MQLGIYLLRKLELPVKERSIKKKSYIGLVVCLILGTLLFLHEYTILWYIVGLINFLIGLSVILSSILENIRRKEQHQVPFTKKIYIGRSFLFFFSSFFYCLVGMSLSHFDYNKIGAFILALAGIISFMMMYLSISILVDNTISLLALSNNNRDRG
jgi:hypothetical protein